MAAKRNPDAETYFQRAEQFNFACNYVSKDERVREVVGFPTVTLRAWAAEAYLKSLIKLEGNQPSPDHSLIVLFDELSAESQRLLNKRWVNDCEPKLKKMKKARVVPNQIDASLRGALTNSAEAFIDFRYIERGQNIQLTIMGFPEFVRDRILEMKPDWRPRPPDLLAWLNPNTQLIERKGQPTIVAPPPPGWAIFNHKTTASNPTPNRKADPKNGRT